jgi:hypothetical protein
MSKHFQFSLRNLFWAIFWLSLCGASWSLLQTVRHYHFSSSEQFLVFKTSLCVLCAATPCFALGAFTGEATTGIIGGVVIGTLTLLVILVLMNSADW